MEPVGPGRDRGRGGAVVEERSSGGPDANSPSLRDVMREWTAACIALQPALLRLHCAYAGPMLSAAQPGVPELKIVADTVARDLDQGVSGAPHLERRVQGYGLLARRPVRGRRAHRLRAESQRRRRRNHTQHPGVPNRLHACSPRSPIQMVTVLQTVIMVCGAGGSQAPHTMTWG